MPIPHRLTFRPVRQTYSENPSRMPLRDSAIIAGVFAAVLVAIVIRAAYL